MVRTDMVQKPAYISARVREDASWLNDRITKKRYRSTKKMIASIIIIPKGVRMFSSVKT